MTRLFFTLIAIFYLSGSVTSAEKLLLQKVDPMIGTDGIGHTFPGATTPFGLVQLSPSTDFKGWNWCSGYHYSDTVLKGFAHTHVSGAGLAGLGDILMMPTSGDVQLLPGSDDDPDSGYRSRFSHERESASPGYYQVLLDDYNIDVELTASARVGFHRYRFNDGGRGNVIFDPTHNIMESVTASKLEIVSDQVVRGFKQSSGEGGDRTVYFYAHCSKPFVASDISTENSLSAGSVSFDTYKGESIEIKVGISHVSAEGAEANYKMEASKISFDEALDCAKDLWIDKLSKIEFKGYSESQNRVFYTALYHSFISPNLISDVTGEYKVEGVKYHSDELQYSTFSTWDTYRALNPLFSIIEHRSTADFVNSLVKRHSLHKVELPVWELVGHDNICMIGYNAVAPMAEAVLKNIDGIDNQSVLDAVVAASNDLTKHSPNYDVNGMEEYLLLNYVPGDINCSVSKTVEQNYYDWSIAKVAEKLGDSDLAAQYYRRSLGYRKLYNPETQYLSPKFRTGKWRGMSSSSWNDYVGNYVSGNIWGYSAYVPHDTEGWIKLLGGEDRLAEWLDKVIADTTKIGGDQHLDISGFIGKYGHGDEPSQHIPYLYNFAKQPWKTQYLVRQVMDQLYSDSPDGLINNEDLGQMSAWYIFSSLGFYPVNPSSGDYIIGSPLVDRATINLENGKTFKIRTENNSSSNRYIQSVKFNGTAYPYSYITHDMIMEGGDLLVVMGSKPNKSWGSDSNYTPRSLTTSEGEDSVIPFTPYDQISGYTFEQSHEVDLNCLTNDAVIYYTLDGTVPSEKSSVYRSPILLDKSTLVKAVAITEEKNKSFIFEQNYYKAKKIDLDINSVKFSEYPHSFGETDGSMLFDGEVGSLHFGDGKWSGWKKDTVTISIDLGEELSISGVNLGYLNHNKVWIFQPKSITVIIPQEGEDYISSKDILLSKSMEGSRLNRREYFSFKDIVSRYVTVQVICHNKIPSWHAAAGEKPLLFLDELMIEVDQ